MESKNFDFSLRNTGNEPVEVELMSSISNNSRKSTKFRSTTPYSATYPIGTTFNVKTTIQDYSFVSVSILTPSDIVNYYNQLNIGSFSLYANNSVDGTIYQVISPYNFLEFGIDTGVVPVPQWNLLTQILGGNANSSIIKGDEIWLIKTTGEIYYSSDLGINLNLIPSANYFDNIGSKLYISPFDNRIFANGNNSGNIPVKIANNNIDFTNRVIASSGNAYGDIFFLNSNEGWIFEDSLYFYKTSDGGNTFSRLLGTKPITVSTGNYRVLSSYFYNSLNGFVAGWEYGAGRAFLWKTSDGGITYTNIETPPANGDLYSSLYMTSPLVGYVAGSFNYESNGLIKYTNDGWATSSVKQNILGSGISKMSMINDQLGYACTYDGKILKTTDGWDTYSVDLDIPTAYFIDIYFEDNSKGIAVSDDGYDTNIYVYY